jgi:hypothetical protein
MRTAWRGCRRWWWAGLAVLLLIVAGFVVSRSIVRVKSMVDHGSVGTDYLKIAAQQSSSRDAALVRAAEEFAKLGSDLDHWSWIITLSTVAPPARRQFRAIEAIRGAGASLVAASASSAGGRDLFRRGRGAEADLCAAAAELARNNGRLYYQLADTRDQLAELISRATGGRC